jgi:uncharacterized membrane protein
MALHKVPQRSIRKPCGKKMKQNSALDQKIKIEPWLADTIGVMVFILGILTVIGSMVFGFILKSVVFVFVFMFIGIFIIVGTIQYTRKVLGWKGWD